MFMFLQLQDFLTTAVPILVKIGVVYLILRFTFAVSNVVVRLSSLNRPKPEPEESSESSSDSVAEIPETVEEEMEEEEKEPAALPESTTED